MRFGIGAGSLFCLDSELLLDSRLLLGVSHRYRAFSPYIFAYFSIHFLRVICQTLYSLFDMVCLMRYLTYF